MDEKTYTVTYHLSNGEKRVVRNVVADAADTAILESQTLTTKEFVELEIGRDLHRISTSQIVEIIVREEQSTEENKRDISQDLRTIKKMGL